MSNFTPEQRTARDSEVARIATLLFADFRSAPMRFWSGAGDLVVDGLTYTGAGDLLEISELDLSPQAFASSFSVSLSGLPDDQFDAYMTLMATDPAEYRLRRITVSMITFDDAWQPIGAPVALATGLMDVPSFSDSSGNGPRIALRCEGPFATRKRPRFGYYTDADQQRRFPGDRGIEFAPTAAGKTVKSPVV